MGEYPFPETEIEIEKIHKHNCTFVTYPVVQLRTKQSMQEKLNNQISSAKIKDKYF